MNRAARAVWELRHAHSEIGYVRAEVYLGGEDDPQTLATDIAGGVLWIDDAGENNRQVILPDGGLARNAVWLAKRRREGHVSD